MKTIALWEEIINNPSFFTNSLGYKIAYHQLPAEPDGITIVALHGYRSDMYGDKIATMYDLAMALECGFLALEYTGNHQSEGDFIADGSISCWANDAYELIQAKVQGKVILVGSSMGGWLAFLLAKKLGEEKIQAIITVAGAPDFTNDLTPLNLGEEGMAKLKQDGVVFEENPYDPESPTPWTYKLYQDGQQNLVMQSPFPYPEIPVRLLHGAADTVVPLQKAMDVMHWLDGDDVELWINKSGDHRLSSMRDLDQLCTAIVAVIPQ